MQLSGTKKFTIIDPARLHTAYPCVQKMMQLQRTAAGEFRPVITDRELDNFPLVNVTHPDLRRHPLYGDSNVFTVEVYPPSISSPAPLAPPRPASSSQADAVAPPCADQGWRCARAARVLVPPGRVVCRSGQAQRGRQLLVPGPLAGHAPLPDAAGERLYQLHRASQARGAPPVQGLGRASALGP